MPRLRLRVKTCFALLLLLAGMTYGRESQERRLRAVFFYTPGCRFCREAETAVREVEAAYPHRLLVERADLSDPVEGPARARRFFVLLDRYGVEETPEIAFFAGNVCLAGGEAVAGGVRQAVQRELAGRAPSPAAVSVDRTGLWAVSAAALADGVNPCAFATVVLLVSMLATAGRSRRETFAAGLAFTLAVYLSYLLIGLFFYGVLRRLAGFLLLSDLIYWAAFGLCIAGALLSLHDAAVAHGRNPHAMLLKLPDRLRNAIRKRLGPVARAGRDALQRGQRAHAEPPRSSAESPAEALGPVARAGRDARLASLAAAAFGAGVIVSLLESVCTGQVYFPVIAGLVRAGDLGRGVVLLLWYNLLFVLPLAAVFGAALLGVTNERLASFARRRVPLAKLLLALVFLAMALWLARGLPWPPGGA